MFCPKCHVEYVPGFTRCSDCDLDLVEELPPAAKRPRKAPPLPDVSAFDVDTGRANLFTEHALLWFLCLPLAAYLILSLAHVHSPAGGASVAAGLAALSVCWAVGTREDRRRRIGPRLLIFSGVVAGYALALPLLLGPTYGGDHLGLWTRDILPLALVAGLLVQNLLSPNAALRRLTQPLSRWRAPWHVYAIALLAWPLLGLLVIELSRHLPAAGRGVLQSGGSVSGILRLAPLELLWWAPWALAWCGFGLPMLLRRRSALTTGLVLGVLTGLQLATPYFVHGHFGRPEPYLNIGGAVALAVVAVWLFQRARGSVWPVFLLTATNASFMLLDWDGGGFGIGTYNAWIALVVAEAAFALVLVVLGRMWMRPEDVPAEPHPDDPGFVEDQRATLIEEHC